MGFSCENEVTIRGLSAEDRRKAAALVLAGDYAETEGGEVPPEGPEGAISLRFASRDSLPESALLELAPRFPELTFTLVYLSLDGEFMGALRARGGSALSDSADLEAADRAAIDRDHAVDPLGFARSSFAGILETPIP